jgi:hypothetical protein
MSYNTQQECNSHYSIASNNTGAGMPYFKVDDLFMNTKMFIIISITIY